MAVEPKDQFNESTFSCMRATDRKIVVEHDPSEHVVEFQITADGKNLEKRTTVIPNGSSNVDFESPEFSEAARRAALRFLRETTVGQV